MTSSGKKPTFAEAWVRLFRELFPGVILDVPEEEEIQFCPEEDEEQLFNRAAPRGRTVGGRVDICSIEVGTCKSCGASCKSDEWSPFGTAIYFSVPGDWDGPYCLPCSAKWKEKKTGEP